MLGMGVMRGSGISSAQAAEPQSGRLSVALGLERLALTPFEAPIVTALAALVITALAIVGIQKIRVDDSLSQLFRSNDLAFKQFEQISRDFPSSEYDVLIVVSGDSLLARDSIDKLRDFVTDVQLIDGARGALSMFSARLPAPQGGMPEPLFPEPLPQGAGYHELIDRVKANEIVRGKLLSEDGRLSVVILSLEPSVVDGGGLDAVVNDIRRTADEDLRGSGLVAELTGVPVMQLEIRHALERDRILYNAIGFALGCAIAGFFFRRLSLMIVAAAPPLIAIVFALGALGWLGFRLNMFLNVMTPLIMVISFSDSMQLTFAARDQLMAGKDKRTAFRNAILIVGPACVLTHAAAGLSLLGLLTSSSDLIRGFGIAGFLATAIALITVLSLVPTFGVLLVRNEARLVATLRNSDSGVAVLRRFCDWIARRMIRRPTLFTLVDLVVVAGLALVYSGLQASYRLADQVPDREQAVAASGRLDAEISGSNPVQVLITFPQNRKLFRRAGLKRSAGYQIVDWKETRALNRRVHQQHQIREFGRSSADRRGGRLDERLRQGRIDDHAAEAVANDYQKAGFPLGSPARTTWRDESRPYGVYPIYPDAPKGIDRAPLGNPLIEVDTATRKLEPSDPFHAGFANLRHTQSTELPQQRRLAIETVHDTIS